MSGEFVVCSKCNQVVVSTYKFCAVCGNDLLAPSGSRPVKTKESQAQGQKGAQKQQAYASYSSQKIGPGIRKAGANNPGVRRHTNIAGNIKSKVLGTKQALTPGSGYLDRYEYGGETLFVCLSGIIISIIALISFNGNWVSLKMPFGGTQGFSLLQVSALTKDIAGFTVFFSPEYTGTLGLVSLFAVLSFFILLIGSIVMLILSVIALLRPAAEAVALVANSLLIRVFAVIALVFMACPILGGGLLGFAPIPLLMLIVAGIPAAIIHFFL